MLPANRPLICIRLIVAFWSAGVLNGLAVFGGEGVPGGGT